MREDKIVIQDHENLIKLKKNPINWQDNVSFINRDETI